MFDDVICSIVMLMFESYLDSMYLCVSWSQLQGAQYTAVMIEKNDNLNSKVVNLAQNLSFFCIQTFEFACLCSHCSGKCSMLLKIS